MIKLSSARRYAKTIFELGQEKGLLEKFSQDMVSLKEVIDKAEGFLSFLANPTYEYTEREKLLLEVASKLGLNQYLVNLIKLLMESNKVKLLLEVASKLGLNQYLVNLIKLLMESNKVKLLPYICNFYQDLQDFYAGKVRGVIKTALPLSNDDLNAIKSAVEKALNKKLELTVQVDKAVIGGVLLKVGDVIYDGTVKKQLEILKDNLIKGLENGNKSRRNQQNNKRADWWF